MRRPALTLTALLLLSITVLFLFQSSEDVHQGSPSRNLLSTEKRSRNDEYDYVIVGAGAAGCALAARLAEKTRASVLLIEAGEANWEDPNLDETAAYTGKNNFFNNNTAPSNDAMYSYPTFLQPDKTVYGVRGLIGAGKGLGGSASINAAMFIVGSSHVWNAYWPRSWSYEVVKPYVKSLVGWIKPDWSNFRAAPTNTFLQAAKNIADRQIRTGGDDFLVNRATPGVAAVEAVGQPNSVDYNDVEGKNSVVTFGQYQISQRKVNATYFERTYGADLFNSTVMNRKTGKGKGVFSRLQLLTGASVVKVVFNKKGGVPTAKAVEYILNGEHFTVEADKEVILTAGTFFTPTILQRSGVGNFDRLKKVGVETLVHHNPLVGKNFRNHYSPHSVVVGSGNATQVSEHFAQFNGVVPGYPFLRGGSFMGWHSLDPNRPAPVAGSSPRKYQVFVAAQLIPIKPHIVAMWNLGAKASTSMSLIPDNIHFESYGTVDIAHPTDPSVIPNLFYEVIPTYAFNAALPVADQLQRAKTVEANTISSLLGYDALYQIVEEMNSVLASQGKDVKLTFALPLHDSLVVFHRGLERLGANWWKSIWTWAMPANASAEDKAFQNAINNILLVIKTAAHLDSHQNGSNKIGDVVDDRLRVLGVKDLRVADLSVSAVPAGGNTMATAYLIGARAADIIIADNE